VAQTPGLAIHAAGLPTGLHVGGTAGVAGTSSWPGDAFTVAGSVGFSAGRLGIVGSLGRINFDGDFFESSLTGGVRGVVRVFGGGLDIPLQVDAFAGYGRFDEPEPDCIDCTRPWSSRGVQQVPAGVSLTLNLSTPVVSIRPWLAPRVQVQTETVGDTGTDELFWGGSAGIDLRFLGGLGLTLAWDKVEDTDPIIGFGLTYRF
jgi:hypothetical protein